MNLVIHNINDCELFDKLTASFAPHIYGYLDIKK